MDIDPDIAPLMEKTRGMLDKVKLELLPMLSELDEDTIVSHYSLDEQARLYLAAAFTMAFSLYSLDRLRHKQYHAIQVSGAGATNKRVYHHASSALEGSASAHVDTQLLFKIERITEYIKKLREITELAKRQPDPPQQLSDESATGKTVEEGETPSRKRAREEGVSGEGRSCAASDSEDLGDAAMFGVVTRVPGETGVLVGRLLRQVEGSLKEQK